MADGSQLGPYDFADDLEYSPDSRRLTFVASRGDKEFLVVDGKELAGRRAIVWKPPFATSLNQCAYAKSKNGRSVTVVGGRDDPAVDAAQIPFLCTPDGKRYAYVAELGQDCLVVHNGKPGTLYPKDVLLAASLRLSPDGRRCAYIVSRGKTSFAVVDGKEQQGFEFTYHPTFSPDSKRLAYITVAGHDAKRWRLVVDGEVGPVQEEGLYSGDALFSPDSQHVVCVTSHNVLLDTARGPDFDEIVYPGPTFHKDGTLEYLMVKADVLYRVKHVAEPITGP